MHHLSTFCGICFSFDGCDQCIVLTPLCQRIDESVGNEIFRVRSFLFRGCCGLLNCFCNLGDCCFHGCLINLTIRTSYKREDHAS